MMSLSTLSTGADSDLLGLADKVALITGGGGQGFGRAQCLELARAGCHIVVGDIDSDGGQETASVVAALGREALFVQADVTLASDIDRLVAAGTERFGKIDVAVNSAGAVLRRAPVLDYDDSDFSQTIRLCLNSVFLCCRAEGLAMARAGVRGSIVNVSSASAFVAADGVGLYGAAKAGVAEFTKTAALEFARFGIRVNAVAPGVMAGPVEPSTPEEIAYRRANEEATAMRRVGDPHEVAGVTVFLASRLSSFVTGQTVIADGGQTVRVNRPQRDRVPAITASEGVVPLFE
jgi:NAD(P)-dependent dehydrogenase (short-subunit alcohol dehydrogenase family)